MRLSNRFQDQNQATRCQKAQSKLDYDAWLTALTNVLSATKKSALSNQILQQKEAKEEER
jgi:hypothetical protein